MKNTANIHPFKFAELDNAIGFARQGKANMIVMGDYGRYWVVTVAEAQRLIRAGYELAPIAF